MPAHDAAFAPSPAGDRYVVTLEGPDTRVLTEYPTHAEAVRAIEQEVDQWRAAGATVTGDLSSGYVARWRQHGQHVSLRLTLGQVQ